MHGDGLVLRCILGIASGMGVDDNARYAAALGRVGSARGERIASSVRFFGAIIGCFNLKQH